MNTKTLTRSSLLVLSAFTFGGCAADTDMVRRGVVNAQTVDSSTLTLGKPRVEQDGDTLHVTGDVRRPDFSPIRDGGHVHVHLVDAAGERVHSTTATYSLPPGRKTPRTPGPRLANYQAQLPGPFPDGGTVRVAICPESHQAIEAQE